MGQGTKVKVKVITKILDIFYPLFRKFLSRELYYYLACGTINTLSDWFLYFIIYNYIVCKQMVDLGFVVISAPIAALIIVTPLTFTIGFLLSKFITFRGSHVKTWRQIFRYALILAANFAISYLSMKILCEACHIWATPSKMITTIFTTIFSYLMQKHYSFRKRNE